MFLHRSLGLGSDWIASDVRVDKLSVVKMHDMSAKGGWMCVLIRETEVESEGWDERKKMTIQRGGWQTRANEPARHERRARGRQRGRETVASQQ